MFASLKRFIHEFRLSNLLTRRLRDASTHIPADFAGVSTCAAPEHMRNFLDHGELELAANQMVEIGEDLEERGIKMAPSFWETLHFAAVEMKMEDDLPRIEMYFKR